MSPGRFLATFAAGVIIGFSGCSNSPPDARPAPGPVQAPASRAKDANPSPTVNYPIPWSAVADPGVESGEVTAAFPLQVEPGAEVSFPRAWPPLAYVYQGKRAELVDLRSGKSLGAVQSPERLPNRPAVSPDGKKMATRLLKEGSHIRIWSFESGRVAGDHVLDNRDKRLSPVSILQFAASDRLVGIRPGVGGGQVVVMNLAQAATPRTFMLASPSPHATLVSNCVGISPTGKYLAALVGQALVMHELESGNCVGTSELPAGAADGFVDGKEIVFSPDGKHLATLLAPPGAAPLHLLEWDAITGKLTQHKQWTKEAWLRESNYTIAHDEHPLAFLPDGSGWTLFGRLAWKREADAPEPVFPGDADPHPRSLLDAKRVVARVQANGQTILQVIMRKDAVPAVMPPAVASKAESWQVKPDPAGATPRIAARPLAVFGNVPQPPRFSKRPGVHAACSIGDEYIVFDLESGAETKRFNPPTGKPLPIRDLSPDGRLLVVAPARTESQWKFEVWNVVTGKLAFQGEENIGSGDESIEFISPGKLLLAHGVQDTGLRRFAVWDIAKAQRTHEFLTPSPRPGGYLSGSHLVSPGGKLSVGGFQEAILVHDIASGELLGKVALPQAAGRTLPQRALASAMTLDGTKLHLVAAYQPDVVRLFTLDMTTGQFSARDLDASRFASVGKERLDLQVSPWLPSDGQWLVCGQAAVNLATGEIVGPLGLQPDSSLVSLAEGKLLLGHMETGLQQSPAAALTPIAIQANAASQLAASVESLRPKPMVAEASKPKPDAPPSKAEPSPATETSSASPPQRKWTPMVDPPADAKPLVPAKQYAMPLPRNARFVASQRGGRCVLVADGDQNTAQVLDLATGKPMGSPFPFPRKTEVAAIDPAGVYVAFSGEKNEITIRAIESGESAVVQRPGTFVKCHFLEFAYDSQVVAAFEADHRTEVLVWKPQGGEPVKRIGLSAARDDWGVRSTGLAISPGGRMLAALRHDGLTVYDLKGSSDGQAAVVPFANRKSQTIVFQCDGICFSPDGKRLAASYAQGQFDNITIWSMETGEPVVFRPSQQRNHLRTITHSDRGPRLHWFADGESLLYTGSILLDATTGCPYWVLSQDAEIVLPLAAQSLLAVEEGTTPRLVAAALPKGVAAARAAVRSSPSEIVPPLSPLDPNPAPLAADALAGPPSVDAMAAKLATGPIRLMNDTPEVRPNRLAVSPAGVLAVEQVVNYIDTSRPVITAGPLTPERDVALETYDLASGKRLHRLSVPERSNLLDVSPDGSLLLTGDELYGSGGYSRLDVWAPRTGKHAAGWLPLPQETDFHDAVSWARFVDKRYVLVLGQQRLVCWQLPECRQMYAIASDAQPCLSANRKLLLERRSGLIRDSLSGKAFGKLEGVPSERLVSLLDAAFSADGKTITGVAAGNSSNTVVRWDAVSGKILSEFAIPPIQFMRVALIGDRGLLLLGHSSVSTHGGTLVDLEQKQAVSSHSASGVHGLSPDGSFWRTDFAIVDKNGAYFAQGFRQDDFAWPKLPSPPAYAVLAPGSKVAVEFQSGLPESARLKSLLDEKVKAAGLVVDSTAAAKIVFTANADRTVIQRTPTEVSIPVIVCRMAVIDASGKAAWESSDRRMQADSTPFDIVKWLESRSLPGYLFHPDWKKQIPASEFPKLRT